MKHIMGTNCCVDETLKMLSKANCPEFGKAGIQIVIKFVEDEKRRVSTRMQTIDTLDKKGYTEIECDYEMFSVDGFTFKSAI